MVKKKTRTAGENKKYILLDHDRRILDILAKENYSGTIIMSHSTQAVVVLRL